MIIYPAIDLIAGEVVRLHKGDFEQKTTYGSDPVSVARACCGCCPGGSGCGRRVLLGSVPRGLDGDQVCSTQGLPR